MAQFGFRSNDTKSKTYGNSKSYGGTASGWWKWVRALFFIGVIVFFFSPMLLAIKDKITRLFEGEATREKRKDIEDIESKINPDWVTISDIDARMRADKIYRAIEHSGTDEDLLNEAFDFGPDKGQLKIGDYEKIWCAFGIRTTHMFFFDDLTGNLGEHLVNECTEAQLVILRYWYENTNCKF